MKLAAIFQVLKNLNDFHDFQTISYCGHFVFQNEAKMFHRQTICRPGLPMAVSHSEAQGPKIRQM